MSPQSTLSELTRDTCPLSDVTRRDTDTRQDTYCTREQEHDEDYCRSTGLILVVCLWPEGGELVASDVFQQTSL